MVTRKKSVASPLTHLDAQGRTRMVDTSDKLTTVRSATARCTVRMKAATMRLLREGRAPKGDVLAVARIAGIQAAKQTPALIPMCHHIQITGAQVLLEPVSRTELAIEAVVRATDRTGVEMEALTAVSVAALAVYDMLKAVDREMVISEIALHEKTGGKSGDFKRALPPSVGSAKRARAVRPQR